MFLSIQLVFCVLELARRGPSGGFRGVRGTVASLRATLKNTEESMYIVI